MEFLRSRIRRTKLGELAYMLINATLPVVLLLLIHSFDSVGPALALVFLSKWRILALRPRFWLVNIKANAVDLLVGMSVVGLLYISIESLPLQLVITVGYGAWLLYLKPKSNNDAIMMQAGIAQFLALTVLFSMSVFVNELFVMVGCFVIGYSVARHVVSSYDEDKIELISYIWGLLLLQMGWLLYHWTIVYDIGLPIQFPQIALIAMVMSFAAARIYALAKAKQLTDTVIRTTTIFAISLIGVILLFARWDVTI